MKSLFLLLPFLYFLTSSGYCEFGQFEITAVCETGETCIELSVQDHMGNKSGYDLKTGKPVEGKYNYGDDYVTSLYGDQSPPIKTLQMMSPQSGIYTTSILGIESGIYSMSIRVSADKVTEKSFWGAINKGGSHKIKIAIPVSSLDEVKINRLIDTHLLEQEAETICGMNSINSNELTEFILNQAKVIKKLARKKQYAEARSEIKKLIEKAQKEQIPLQFKDPKLTKIERIISDFEVKKEPSEILTLITEVTQTDDSLSFISQIIADRSGYYEKYHPYDTPQAKLTSIKRELSIAKYDNDPMSNKLLNILIEDGNALLANLEQN